MYMGHIQNFIDKERNMEYNDLLGKYESKKENEYIFKNDKELIEKYIEILWYATNPLYSFQFEPMANIMKKIEEKISSKIINDLELLSDKDLIKKYNISPHKISIKYLNINIENIKDSAKTDILYKRDIFWNNYKENLQKWRNQNDDR